MADCSNCGGAPAYARGRCRHCYRYFLRHGTERPLDLQRRLVERQIEARALALIDGLEKARDALLVRPQGE